MRKKTDSKQSTWNWKRLCQDDRNKQHQQKNKFNDDWVEKKYIQTTLKNSKNKLNWKQNPSMPPFRNISIMPILPRAPTAISTFWAFDEGLMNFEFFRWFWHESDAKSVEFKNQKTQNTHTPFITSATLSFGLLWFTENWPPRPRARCPKIMLLRDCYTLWWADLL